MLQVTFIILPKPGDEIPDPSVAYFGTLNRVPSEGEYVYVEPSGTEYKVVAVTHQFAELKKMTISKAEAERLEELSEEELAEGEPMDFPAPMQAITVSLRPIDDEEERAIAKERRRSTIKAVEDLRVEIADTAQSQIA